MTKQQFDDLYLGKAVHCNTEEKANKFLELAHEVGYKWCSEESLLEENNYHYYQEKTCYLVGRDGFEYCDKYYYIEKGYEVVEFKQETRYANELTKTKPLKKITKEEEKGEIRKDDKM